jgi:hypothetical protein
MQILHNPLYAGAYAFGKNAQRTRIVDGRAHKVSGFRKPREEWTVLLRDNHASYISWAGISHRLQHYRARAVAIHPEGRRAVRGNSNIAEAQLIGR